jgi:hypothetical protein
MPACSTCGREIQGDFAVRRDVVARAKSELDGRANMVMASRARERLEEARKEKR